MTAHIDALSTDRELITAYLDALRDMRHGGSKAYVTTLSDMLRQRGYSLSPTELKERLS